MVALMFGMSGTENLFVRFRMLTKQKLLVHSRKNESLRLVWEINSA